MFLLKILFVVQFEFFLGIVRYETILSDADWIINTSSSKSAQFIYIYFFDFVLFYWI